MADRIQIRGDSAANWSSVNPILADRELGFETDTRKFKFGNGVTAWSGLSYSASDASAAGMLSALLTVDGTGSGLDADLLDGLHATAFEAANANIQSHIGSSANPHTVTKTQVGLNNVDNTSDLNKPVSTAQQSALDLKSNLNSPTFTGTVGGIDKSMIGLGNVDNTSDTNKPVSTATQTAINLKANNVVTTVTSGNSTMSAVDNTYYVYLVAGLHTMTLPTAISNKCIYTIKNNHSAAITIDTTAAQTIDGTTTIQISPEDAVDIISDNANWSIF